MKVIPKVSYAQTADVTVGRFVFLFAGAKPALAVRSRIPGPNDAHEEVVIRLDVAPDGFETLDQQPTCLLVDARDLMWRVDITRIQIASTPMAGSVVVLPTGAYFVAQADVEQRSVQKRSLVLALATGKCTHHVFHRSIPTLNWTIVDGEKHVYAQGPAAN
jgi:hypothetical protein